MEATRRCSPRSALASISLVCALSVAALAQDTQVEDVLFTSEGTTPLEYQDFVGCAVGLTDFHAAVGAYSWGPTITAGAVLMFQLTESGWQRAQVLLPADMVTGSRFGGRLAIDDSTLVVGATSHNFPVLATGHAYVFERIGGTWVETASIEPPDPQVAMAFGRSVAVDGNCMLIGAPGHDSPQGIVYAYERGAGGWMLVSELVGPPGLFGLGLALALQGETAAVSAPWSNGPTVYVFEKQGLAWSLTHEIEIMNSPAASISGASVALDGDTIVVGETVSGGPFGGHPGRAIVFEKIAGTWVQTQELLASDAQSIPYGEQFGISVDLRGDRLVVGAHHAMEPEGQTGSAYLFERINGSWIETKKFRTTTPDAGGWNGVSVALNDSMALVGAQLYEVAGVRAGAALGYLLPMGTPTCDGEPNSTAAAGELEATGSYVADLGQLTLRARDLPPGQPGIFLVSMGSAFLPGAGGGQGTLCLGWPVRRIRPLQQTDNGGGMALHLDLTNLPLPALAGQELHFQAWYRDTNPVFTHNLTGSLSIRFR